MQLDARCEQCLVVLCEARLLAGPQYGQCRFGPPQRVDIAQPTPTFFQIGLEQEGDLAVLDLTVFDPLAQFVERAA